MAFVAPPGGWLHQRHGNHQVGHQPGQLWETIKKVINPGKRREKGSDASTVTPAIIYFPSGTYMVSTLIIQYYYLGGSPPSSQTYISESTYTSLYLRNLPYLHVDINMIAQPRAPCAVSRKAQIPMVDGEKLRTSAR